MVTCHLHAGRWLSTVHIILLSASGHPDCRVGPRTMVYIFMKVPVAVTVLPHFGHTVFLFTLFQECQCESVVHLFTCSQCECPCRRLAESWPFCLMTASRVQLCEYCRYKCDDRCSDNYYFIRRRGRKEQEGWKWKKKRFVRGGLNSVQIVVYGICHGQRVASIVSKGCHE